MTLFEALREEHRLFRLLLARLEAALALPDRQARTAASEIFAALLPALEGHEDLEHALLAAEPAPGEDGLARVVEAQRLDLENLREDLHSLLREPEVAQRRLKAMTALLGAKLEAHFLSEETTVWPALARRGSRSLEASLARRARLRLDRLEEEIACRRSRLDDLLRR